MIVVAVGIRVVILDSGMEMMTICEKGSGGFTEKVKVIVLLMR